MENVMTDEIWKDIDGYGSKYMVSNHGRVKNCQRNKMMSLYPNLSRGYLEVSLSTDGKSHSVRVHRLVASAFLPKTDVEVNHKDGNKRNNHVSNLEWCSSQYNSEHATGRSGCLLSPDGEVKSFSAMSQFCRDNGLNLASISKLLDGKISQHHGWRVHG